MSEYAAFNASKVEGGWIVQTDVQGVGKQSVVVKDNDVVKKLKAVIAGVNGEVAEATEDKRVTLNEG